MSPIKKLREVSKDQTINLAIDTINLKKQALVFNNTKSSAEKTAEDISKKVNIGIYDKDTQEKLDGLSNNILDALSKPTKQCERLARCVKKGIAYHHAGLVSKQKELIEDNFRNGLIRVISSTPTLAIGMDLPAFRAIMKSMKRFTSRGMQYIPVLEYLQMAGRAGRPGKEDYGESIMVAGSDGEFDQLYEKYIQGVPEDIYSKLAVEPVLRTYLLSLITTGLIKDYQTTVDFFEQTFWAYQFKDMYKLERIIKSMIDLLEDYKFIVASENSTTTNSDFMSADELTKQIKDNPKFKPTPIGARVSQIYIDPYTANYIIGCLDRSDAIVTDFALLQMVCFTLEMRPLLKLRATETEKITQRFLEKEDELITLQPTIYDFNYDDYMNSMKTAFMLYDWINEADDQYLVEEYNIRPGEVRYKTDRADWLLYAAEEIARVQGLSRIMAPIKRLRLRLKDGVKEELLPLLQLKNIGKVRARKLYANNLRDLGAIRKIDFTTLRQLIGQAIAKDVKQQLGEKVDEEMIVKPTKRKGQLSLDKF